MNPIRYFILSLFHKYLFNKYLQGHTLWQTEGGATLGQDCHQVQPLAADPFLGSEHCHLLFQCKTSETSQDNHV